MTISQLTQQIKNHLLLIFTLPSLIAGLIFFLTRNEIREYNSNAVIYTGLTSGYTLESSQNNRILNNSFDNILTIVKSRSTLEEVGIRLLATHLMLRRPDPAIANAHTIKHLKTVIPESVRNRIVNFSSPKRTVENIYRYSEIPNNIISEKLLNANDEPYSAKGIRAKLTAIREGKSDMVRLNYLSTDAAVAKQTLELINLVFMRRYQELKGSEIRTDIGSLQELNNSKIEVSAKKFFQNWINSTNVQVLDAPKLADQPESTNRILLIFIGFTVGFIFSIGFSIGKTYFNKSIKNPKRAEYLTGLRFTGALPHFKDDLKQVPWGSIEHQTINQCISKLKKWSNQQTHLVIIASSREGEGKSFFTKKLVRQLNQYGIRSISKSVEDFQLKQHYEYAGEFDEEDELISVFDKYQYVFVEIPALLLETIPTEITKKAAFTLWICDAARTWTTADRYVLTTYQENTLTPIGLILNRMALDDIEVITGEFKNLKPPFLQKAN